MPADGEALVEVLTDQVSYFREQLSEEREARRRADTIIAQLTHTNTQLSNHVLELDAPARSTQAPEPNEEAAQDTTNGAPGPPGAPGGRRGGSERLWARVVVAQDVRRAGGGIVLENSDRALEEVHGWSEASLANPREQDAEERRGRRVASEVVALVSASVLVGGGISVLGGVALGAINPFACGMVGVVAGIGLPVLLGSVVGAREGVKGPWWRRIFGG